MNFDPVLYMESKKQNKKIKEENILKKEEIGISETASENKKRRGRPTVSLQNQASCRECFSVVKTLEGDRYALCEKLLLFPFCCSHQMHRYLAGCFGLISGRHCLDLIG